MHFGCMHVRKTNILHQPKCCFPTAGNIYIWVVATQVFFVFNPIPGEMIQFDEHIFQMGW